MATKKATRDEWLLMSVDTDFDRTVPIRKILSYLIVQSQIISKQLSIAARYAVSEQVLIVPDYHKSKSIVSAIRRATPACPADILEPCLDISDLSTYHWLPTMYGKAGSANLNIIFINKQYHNSIYDNITAQQTTQELTWQK